MNRLFGAATMVLFFATVAVFGCFQIIDTDVWLYLKAGEHICQTLRPLRADIFSYTAAGQPWIDAHWLSQVVLWLAYAAGGSVGLCVLRLALVVTLFAVLYRCCRLLAGELIVTAVLTLALLIANDGFLIKPHLLSLLLAALFVAILERAPRSPRARLWPLIPLQILWANMHPSFFLGPFLILAYLFNALLRPGTRAGYLNKLVITLPLVACASLLTPYGFALLTQPLLQTTTRLFMQTVSPWTPPSSAFPAPFSVFFFTLMLVLSIAALGLNAKRMRPSDAMILAVVGLLAMRSRRHLPLFAVLAAPGLCWNLGSCASWLGQRRHAMVKPARRASAAALCLVSILLISLVLRGDYYFRQRSLKRFGLGRSQLAFPDAAMDFLDSSGTEGRVFCNYDIGSCFAGRFYPDRLVFIDGRNLVFGEGLLRRYLEAMGDVSALNRLANEYGITALLLTHVSRDVRALLPSLWKSADWTPVYADDRALVFFRSSRTRRASGVNPEQDPLPGVPSTGRFPLAELRAGELYYTLGYVRRAGDMFAAALARYPALPEAHNFLGMIALREGKRASAIGEMKEACAGSRSYAEPRINLSLALLAEGRMPEAERYARDAVRIAPANARALGALGLAYLSQNKISPAIRALEQAARRDPGEAEYRSNLGVAYEREGDLERARAEYETACSLPGSLFAPRFNLALLHAKTGNTAEAVARYEEALAIDPSHAGARRNLAELLIARGDTGRAVELLWKLLGENPDDRGARVLLENISRAVERGH